MLGSTRYGKDPVERFHRLKPIRGWVYTLNGLACKHGRAHMRVRLAHICKASSCIKTFLDKHCCTRDSAADRPHLTEELSAGYT